jgi:hypothetical protein
MFAKYYKKEIAEYCAQNGLSANKVFQSPVSYSDTRVRVLHHTPIKVKKEILSIGGPPMPITLEIYLENGKLRFEQTEHTYKYLAEEEHETAQTAYG